MSSKEKLFQPMVWLKFKDNTSLLLSFTYSQGLLNTLLTLVEKKKNAPQGQ